MDTILPSPDTQPANVRTPPPKRGEGLLPSTPAPTPRPPLLLEDDTLTRGDTLVLQAFAVRSLASNWKRLKRPPVRPPGLQWSSQAFPHTELPGTQLTANPASRVAVAFTSVPSRQTHTSSYDRRSGIPDCRPIPVPSLGKDLEGPHTTTGLNPRTAKAFTARSLTSNWKEIKRPPVRPLGLQWPSQPSPHAEL